jgi:aldose sugar dehydrogenase
VIMMIVLLTASVALVSLITFFPSSMKLANDLILPINSANNASGTPVPPTDNMTLTEKDDDVPTTQGPEVPPVKFADPSLKADVIMYGLEFPTGIDFIDEDDFLVIERFRGTVMRVSDGQLMKEPLLDLNVAWLGERGLLGIALSKSEDEPRYVFLYFTESAGEKDGTDATQGLEPLGNRLYRYELAANNTKLINPKLLITLPALPGPIHNGGKVVIGPDDNVYLIIGDLSNMTQVDSGMGIGGILRITQDGRMVDSEAIFANNNPSSLYFGYGLRNGFGLDFDPVTGKLWDTENGPEFGDEINLVEPGFNSGWITVQGMWKTTYAPSGIAVPGTVIQEQDEILTNLWGDGNYSSPEFATYNFTIAPTAIKFLPSSKLGKQYENTLFVGDVYGRLYNFKLNSERSGLLMEGTLSDRVANSLEELSQVILGEGFSTITDIKVTPNGELYVVLYGYGGYVLRVASVAGEIDLLGPSHNWTSVNGVTLERDEKELEIWLLNRGINTNEIVFNRAELQVDPEAILPQSLEEESKSLSLDLQYSSATTLGNATFGVEIRLLDNKEGIMTPGKEIWDDGLHNTNGTQVVQRYLLPDEIRNSSFVLRFLIVDRTGPLGVHVLSIPKVSLVY